MKGVIIRNGWAENKIILQQLINIEKKVWACILAPVESVTIRG
jgi:hypothetical protein